MPKEIKNETLNIESDRLLESVMNLKNNGYRLIQICATKTDKYILDYSFGKDYSFFNYKIIFQDPIELPSITDFFPGAFLYENEISELFGLKINGINIDFKGTLYKVKTKNAFVLSVPSSDS